jgi:hypothetical protein
MAKASHVMGGCERRRRVPLKVHGAVMHREEALHG